MPLEGVDISNNQGQVDWAKISAAGKRFAFVKATEGTWFHDGWFQYNWQELANQEMWRGAYHFAAPGHTASGAAEANYFCDMVLQVPQLQGDMYVLDLETGPPGADLNAYVHDFCQTVEARTATSPIIYTTAGMLKQWKVQPDPYPLWLASWGSTWPQYQGARAPFWQYDDKGSCPGVNGHCDMDRFGGTEDDLYSYGWAG